MKLIFAITILLLTAASIKSQDGIPGTLLSNLEKAKRSYDQEAIQNAENELRPFLQFEGLQEPGQEMHLRQPDGEEPGDWTNQDFLVTNSQIGLRGFRQTDLKTGEDGWLYLAAIVNNSSYNGNYKVWASSNGGHSWNNILNVTSTQYMFSISMTVESKNNAIGDSTRVVVFVTTGPNTNGNDTKISFSSVRRDGTGSYIGSSLNPAAGNRYTYVSVCSDGAYYSVNTYLYIVTAEFLNTGGFAGLRMFKTTDMGASFTSSLIQSTSQPFDGDYYPSAAFYQSPNNGIDSIFIAVQRLWDGNSTIKLVTTPVTNSGSFKDHSILTVFIETNVRPCITIAQQKPAKSILITYTFDNKVYTAYSTNSGASWENAEQVANTTAGYTWCSSDTLGAGGSNFVMAYSNQTGDSVTIKKGTPGNWTNTAFKVNNVNTSILSSPVCALYKIANTKNAVTAFTGSGNNGLYFDNELFVIGINQIGSSVPEGFSLSQNYPNPFNPVTNIKFSVPKGGTVKLLVYDVNGKEVSKLIDQNMNTGSYNFDFDASKLSSGVYFYRLTAGEFSEVKKMILIK